MKNVFILLNIIIFIACVNNKKKDYYSDKEVPTIQSLKDSLKEIVFFENNLSIPANFDLYKYKEIKINKDSCFLVEYTYIKGKFNNSKILKSIKTIQKHRIIILKADRTSIENSIQITNDKYSMDESVFKATFFFKSKKNKVWNIDYNKTKRNINLQLFYDMYFEIKQELYK